MRYNIVVSIKRGRHEEYIYNHNKQPVRPGKVQKVFHEAIADVMGNVTRNGKHEHNGYFYGDDIYVGVSDGVTVTVTVVTLPGAA